MFDCFVLLEGSDITSIPDMVEALDFSALFLRKVFGLSVLSAFRSYL